MKHSIIIGIDPAFRIKGFSIAIIDYTDRTVNFKTFKNGFIDFSSWLLHDSPDSAVICIENSNLTNATFYSHRCKKTKKLLTSWQAKKNPNAQPLSKNELSKMSRDVGKNQAISQITYDICKVFDKFDTYQISPKEKGAKWNTLHFKGVLKAERLTITIPIDKVTQDEIDGLQMALHGKRLSIRPKLTTINQKIKRK